LTVPAERACDETGRTCGDPAPRRANASPRVVCRGAREGAAAAAEPVSTALHSQTHLYKCTSTAQVLLNAHVIRNRPVPSQRISGKSSCPSSCRSRGAPGLSSRRAVRGSGRRGTCARGGRPHAGGRSIAIRRLCGLALHAVALRPRALDERLQRQHTTAVSPHPPPRTRRAGCWRRAGWGRVYCDSANAPDMLRDQHAKLVRASANIFGQPYAAGSHRIASFSAQLTHVCRATVPARVCATSRPLHW